jgi:tetratricopeptide (TPR) repeat protein
MDDYDSAINEMLAARKYIEKQFPENIINVRPLYIQLLVEKGEIAEAETECERLRVDSEVAGLPMAFYQYSLGCVELAKGNTRAAVKAIEKIADDSPENDRVIVEALTLGRAYIRNGDYEKAIDVLESQMSIYNPLRAYFASWSVQLHYYLGIAYEKTAQVDKAIVQYETFISILRNADPGNDLLEDAANRLEKLKISS